MDDADYVNDEIPYQLWRQIFKFRLYDIFDDTFYRIYNCSFCDFYICYIHLQQNDF